MGLVKRENCKYRVTTLGNVVYDAVSMVGKALNYYWALNAIELVLSSSPAADSRGDKSLDYQLELIVTKKWCVNPH